MINYWIQSLWRGCADRRRNRTSRDGALFRTLRRRSRRRDLIRSRIQISPDIGDDPSQKVAFEGECMGVHPPTLCMHTIDFICLSMPLVVWTYRLDRSDTGPIKPPKDTLETYNVLLPIRPTVRF
jgi:hypothetical protein